MTFELQDAFVRHVGKNIGRQWERTGKRVRQTQSITISSILRETRIQIVLAAAHKNSLGPNFVHFFLTHVHTPKFIITTTLYLHQSDNI